MGMHKHRVAGHPHTPEKVKRETAEFFNKEAERRPNRTTKFYRSVREILRNHKPQ